MNFESIISMAKGSSKQEKPKKLEKTQEELRVALEEKLNTLRNPIQEGITEYKQALKDGLFDDQEGEENGSGEKRQEIMKKKINDIVERAEKIKVKLDSGEIISQTTPEISTSYTHPDGRKETISIDFESKLQDFLSFYQKNNLNLSANFEDDAHDIWEKNHDDIEQAIEQNGFDEILIIPGGIPLPELSDKMKVGNQYYLSDNFKEGGSFAKAVSQNTNKTRILLVHKVQGLDDCPELKKTLNIKGKDVKLDQALTLEDYLVFQKKYFEETGKHLDVNRATWLATKSGARLVGSGWNSGELSVHANGLETQHDLLGVRSSRCFF